MTGCIDTPTAEPPMSVPNIEARLGRIENALDRIETFLELTRSRTPPEKKHWLNAEMERQKCISWELLADDLKFKALFLTPRHFHNIATELAELKGWRSEKIDKNRFQVKGLAACECVLKFSDGKNETSVKLRVVKK